MHKRSYTFLLVLLIVSPHIALGKNGNNTNIHEINNKHYNVKGDYFGSRAKRSLNEDERSPFWANSGKKIAEYSEYDNSLSKIGENDNIVYGTIEKEPPFWAIRGRRDSSSSENNGDVEYTENNYNDLNLHNLFCKSCLSESRMIYRNAKDRRDELYPFWGNRGRRDSSEVDENFPSEPFWGNRGRRTENTMFSGNRSRREDEPFWGNRGRRQESPFWGSRGRREDEPFWGNRGRRQDSDLFWSNRGRRQESEPFWGNRGRRDESEPFWGNRGRRRESKQYSGSRSKQKQDLKESILSSITDVKDDIVTLSKLRRSENFGIDSFWGNRGRNSKLKYLFDGLSRSRPLFIPNKINKPSYGANIKAPEPKTVHNSRIYAEEPHYILVERSSRSSGEDDPYFISRGKKYYTSYGLVKPARDRRGAIEEIVKSVRNDPYYIARGKKDTEIVKNGNMSYEEFLKVKNLICDVINSMMETNEKTQVKSEINENDRDRRTILKKLAAQLQTDPYYVSRGKKHKLTGIKEDYLHVFINNVAEECN